MWLDGLAVSKVVRNRDDDKRPILAPVTDCEALELERFGSSQQASFIHSQRITSSQTSLPNRQQNIFVILYPRSLQGRISSHLFESQPTQGSLLCGSDQTHHRTTLYLYYTPKTARTNTITIITTPHRL